MQQCVDLHLYSSTCIVFCIFSCFYWGRAKFNKSEFILALYMFICLCKFKIIQYMLKYKCICIFILSYYTYSGTEYSDRSFFNNTWVLQCLFSCFSHLHLPWRMPLSTYRGLIPKLSTQWRYTFQIFWFDLNVQLLALATHACVSCANISCWYFCIHVWAPIGT